MTETSTEIVKDVFNMRKHSAKIIPMNHSGELEMKQFKSYEKSEEMSDDDDDDDDEENKKIDGINSGKLNIFKKVKTRVKLFLKASLSNFLVKIILIGILCVAYLVYFGISMYNNNPFRFLKSNSSTSKDIYDDYIFSDNRGKSENI